MNYLPVGAQFLKFWFIESPVSLFQFFLSLNSAFFHFFSLPLLVQTFFKPLKNEYRQGLVKFSIAMGIIIKSFLIIADLILFIGLLVAEIAIFIAYVLFPFTTVAMLFL
jgi:hypothetical protein